MRWIWNDKKLNAILAPAKKDRKKFQEKAAASAKNVSTEAVVKNAQQSPTAKKSVTKKHQAKVSLKFW